MKRPINKKEIIILKGCASNNKALDDVTQNLKKSGWIHLCPVKCQFSSCGDWSKSHTKLTGKVETLTAPQGNFTSLTSQTLRFRSKTQILAKFTEDGHQNRSYLGHKTNLKVFKRINIIQSLTDLFVCFMYLLLEDWCWSLQL